LDLEMLKVVVIQMVVEQVLVGLVDLMEMTNRVDKHHQMVEVEELLFVGVKK
jgi:hypothetical protein